MEGASDGGAMGKQHASEVQCRVLCARVRGVPGLGWSEMWRENERRLGVRERERKGVWEDEEKRQMEYMMHAMTSLQTTYGGGGGGGGIGRELMKSVHTDADVIQNARKGVDDVMAMEMHAMLPHVLLPRAACEVLRQRAESKAYTFDIEPRLVAAFEPRSLVRTALKGAALGFAKPVAEWFRVWTGVSHSLSLFVCFSLFPVFSHTTMMMMTLCAHRMHASASTNVCVCVCVCVCVNNAR